MDVPEHGWMKPEVSSTAGIAALHIPVPTIGRASKSSAPSQCCAYKCSDSLITALLELLRPLTHSVLPNEGYVEQFFEAYVERWTAGAQHVMSALQVGDSLATHCIL